MVPLELEPSVTFVTLDAVGRIKLLPPLPFRVRPTAPDDLVVLLVELVEVKALAALDPLPLL